jgi:hypothetical protein
MSLKLLKDTVETLPRMLAAQVIGYAESVNRSLPDIFRDAGKPFDSSAANQLVFLADLSKLYSITSSSYWVLDNSAALLSRLQVDVIHAGGIEYSRGGPFYERLRDLLNAFDDLAGQHDLGKYFNVPPLEIPKIFLNDEH